MLSSVEEQKTAGADFVSGVGAVRRAANEFDKDVPQAAQYIRLAADQIGTVSDAIRAQAADRLSRRSRPCWIRRCAFSEDVNRSGKC